MKNKLVLLILIISSSVLAESSECIKGEKTGKFRENYCCENLLPIPADKTFQCQIEKDPPADKTLKTIYPDLQFIDSKIEITWQPEGTEDFYALFRVNSNLELVPAVIVFTKNLKRTIYSDSEVTSDVASDTEVIKFVDKDILSPPQNNVYKIISYNANGELTAESPYFNFYAPVLPEVFSTPSSTKETPREDKFFTRIVFPKALKVIGNEYGFNTLGMGVPDVLNKMTSLHQQKIISNIGKISSLISFDTFPNVTYEFRMDNSHNNLSKISPMIGVTLHDPNNLEVFTTSYEQYTDSDYSDFIFGVSGNPLMRTTKPFRERRFTARTMNDNKKNYDSEQNSTLLESPDLGRGEDPVLGAVRIFKEGRSEISSQIANYTNLNSAYLKQLSSNLTFEKNRNLSNVARSIIEQTIPKSELGTIVDSGFNTKLTYKDGVLDSTTYWINFNPADVKKSDLCKSVRSIYNVCQRSIYTLTIVTSRHSAYIMVDRKSKESPMSWVVYKTDNVSINVK